MFLEALLVDPVWQKRLQTAPKAAGKALPNGAFIKIDTFDVLM